MGSNTIVRKAVIPVAGLGTRFFPIAKAIPKEMLQVIDKPVIHYIVSEAFEAGIEQIILVNGRHKTCIEDYFDTAYDLELNNQIICSVRQKEALGLGHAILCAQNLVGNEPFAVLLGDDVILANKQEKPAIKQLIEAFGETKKPQIALMQVPQKDTQKYGIARVRESSSPEFLHIENLVEKPPVGSEPSDLAIIGRYVLPPSIWPILNNLKPGIGGEIQLTDALIQLMKIEGLMGYRFLGQRIDAGEPLGLLELNLIEAFKRLSMQEGLKTILAKILAPHS